MNTNTFKDAIKKEKVFKFHQFIHVKKGAFNSAVIDLLKGDVYQVQNEILDKMEMGAYDEIEEFLVSAIQEDLVIKVKPNTWIPRDESEAESDTTDQKSDQEISVTLVVEEGVNVAFVFEKLKGHSLYKVVYYGPELPESLVSLKNLEIIRLDKDYIQCQKLACVKGDFNKITHSSYLFNQRFNSCWGTKIAITSDGKVRPCIYSEISIGDIESLSIHQIIEGLKPYWELTKDKVEICKDCELRYVCFDCREIARRQGGDILAPNPLCQYDPCSGRWKQL